MKNIVLSFIVLLISQIAVGQNTSFYTSYNNLASKTSFKDNEGIIVHFKDIKNVANVSKALYFTMYADDKLLLFYKIDHKSEFMNALASMSEAEGGNQFDLILFPSSEIINTIQEAQADPNKMTVPLMSGFTYIKDPEGVHYRFIMTRFAGLVKANTPTNIKVQMEDGFINDLGDYETAKVIHSGTFSYTMSPASLEELKPILAPTAKAMVETVADNGAKNDFHKKNIGKIVFSNKLISADDASGTGASTSFSGFNSGIYGRVYLDKSLRNKNAAVAESDRTSNQNVYVEIYIDDKYAGLSSFPVKENLDNATSWAYCYAPSSSEKTLFDINMLFGGASALKNIEPGTHKVRFVVNNAYKNRYSGRWLNYVVAEGEIKLTFTAAEKDAFIKACTPPPPPPCNYLGRVYLQNNTGVKINYAFGGCRVTEGGSLSPGQKTSFPNPAVGSTIRINGKEFVTVGAGDDGETYNVLYAY